MLLGVLALEVRALEVRVVGADADPGQRVDDALRPLGPVAGLVGVLDAQHERAAVALGERPVAQRGAGAADVEEAGGRGREAEAGADVHAPTEATAPPTGSVVATVACWVVEDEVAQLADGDRERGDVVARRRGGSR